MNRQLQTGLVVVAVVLTSPIWVAILWDMFTPLGVAELVTAAIVLTLVAAFGVSRILAKRARKTQAD